MEKTNLGCYIDCECFNSIMYADDLILMSISIHQMQEMVDICVKAFEAIGMNINIRKSGCIRIGERHNIAVQPIIIDNLPLSQVVEVRYLGIIILAARKFTFNLQNVKQKFFRALNGIFGKVGLNTSLDVLCSLIESQCVPILLFAAESLKWSNKTLKSIENAYNQVFFKIFQTFDKELVKQCQYNLGYLPMRLLLDVRKLNFLTKLNNMSHYVMHKLVSKTDDEYLDLCQKYNFVMNPKCFNFKHVMWRYFESINDF